MSMGNKEVLANNLKYYMDKHNVTRNDLVDDLNIAYMTISDWINAKTYPRIDKIELLAHYFQIEKSDLIEYHGNKSIIDEIIEVSSQLHDERQIKVYNYAERQLDEQNKVIDINKYNKNDIEDDLVEEVMEGYLSAGTGEFLAEDIKQPIMIHKSLLPEQHYDMVLQVNGDSMEPMFRNKEYIFVRKTEDLRSGQIGVFIIDGESYLKKVYINDDHIKLVSLNQKYDDLIFSDVNDIEVIGTVVM